jgi:hypothetical protein
MVVAGGVIALMLALAGGAEAKLGVLDRGAGPVASAASVSASAAAAKPWRYRKLRQLDLGVRGATLRGRVVSVRISNRQPVEVRLAVVRDRQRKLQAWNAVKLEPGVRTLTRRLNTTPKGSQLNLRVTARIGGVKAREIIALKKVRPGTSGSSDAPVPFPHNSPPASLALVGSSVGENQPAGTTVGTLSASDPNAGDRLRFSLVGGAGSDDTAAFTLSGATLRTAAGFDFETKASYAIRVRVSDGRGGALEAALTITVTDVDDLPVAVNDVATVGEDAAATPVGVLSNDADSDGGPKAIASASDPANGTVVITGGGTGLTYQPDADYCNSPLGSADTFTYVLNGGSSATVAMTVTCVDDAP